jgi:hypothetical protein
MKFTILAILPKCLLKIAANASLAVGCLLMVSCDGGLAALAIDKATDDDSKSSSAQAPSTINGVSVRLIDADLLLTIAENGVDWYTAREFKGEGSPLGDGDVGTLTYESSGNNGIIEYVALDGDTEKATLTFKSNSTGTYVITDNGANVTGSFTLIDTSQIEPPSSIAGQTIFYGISEATGFFADAGSYEINISNDEQSFTGTGFGVNDSLGSFTYSQTGNVGFFGDTEVQEFQNETDILVREYQAEWKLTFLTETSGTFLVLAPDSFQVGTFEIIDGP